MKALVGAFNQEKALVGAFSVIVQPVVEPMEHCTALLLLLLSSGPVCSEGPRNGWWENSELLLHIAADSRPVAAGPDIRCADRL